MYGGNTKTIAIPIYTVLPYCVIYITDRVHTYRIVLNVSTRFYFSVYATISLEPRASCCLCHGQFHWSLVRLAVFVTVNSRAPCLVTPCTHLGHHQLRQCQVYNRSFLVLERSQLLLRFASTNNYAVFSTVNHNYYVCTTWHGASLCSSVYTSTCRFAERAVLRFVTGRFIEYDIRYTD